MFQILDKATLLRLMDAPSAAVLDTIERGGWSGCVWPDHPEWEAHEACVQIYSLALHYFTTRHPDAEPRRYALAGQILGSQGCPQGGIAHLDADPLVDQVILWWWALAGGLEASGPVVLPGEDVAAFTTAALEVIDALLFAGDTAAQHSAVAFLQALPDTQARRALDLVAAIMRQSTAQTVDAGVICAHCGAEGLDMWYTGQTWGENLCESCYDARVATGQARPPDL